MKIPHYCSIAICMFALAMASCTSNDDNPIIEVPDHAPSGVVAVDLGLPSGTKWANMNVGAETPEDFGLYFAWGECNGYTEDTTDGRLFSWEHYKWSDETGTILTKYSTTDGKQVLDLEDDAANVNWGGQWVMATAEEFNELIENTTSDMVTLNGIYGRLYKSNVNDNTLFMPASGFRIDSDLFRRNYGGQYWTASLNTEEPSYACNYNLKKLTVTSNEYPRSYGFAIRPVIRKEK